MTDNFFVKPGIIVLNISHGQQSYDLPASSFCKNVIAAITDVFQ